MNDRNFSVEMAKPCTWSISDYVRMVYVHVHTCTKPIVFTSIVYTVSQRRDLYAFAHISGKY
jgi:hypothetical protein